MNKETFLSRLEQLLYDIPREEREEAMDYYRSYFEEAGEENEAAVLDELDSPQKIAASIKEDLKRPGNETGQLKNPPQVRGKEQQSQAQDAKYRRYNESEKGSAKYRRYNEPEKSGRGYRRYNEPDREDGNYSHFNGPEEEGEKYSHYNESDRKDEKYSHYNVPEGEDETYSGYNEPEGGGGEYRRYDDGGESGGEYRHYDEPGTGDTDYSRYNETQQDTASPFGSRYGQYEKHTENKRKSSGMDRQTKMILLIILAVFSFPIWGSVASIVVGIIGIVIAAVAALAVFTVGGIIGGLVCAVVGIVNLCMLSLIKGLLALGVGMLLIAGGGISFVFILLVCGRFLPWAVRQILNLLRRLLDWGRSMA